MTPGTCVAILRGRHVVAFGYLRSLRPGSRVYFDATRPVWGPWLKYDLDEPRTLRVVRARAWMRRALATRSP
jgi:hypothetical protein